MQIKHAGSEWQGNHRTAARRARHLLVEEIIHLVEVEELVVNSMLHWLEFAALHPFRTLGFRHGVPLLLIHAVIQA